MYADCDVIGVAFRFVHEPEDVYAVRGGSTRFDCVASEGNDETEIRWLFNEAPLPPLKDSYHVISNGSLIISNVARRTATSNGHDGFYECLARNSLGTIISRRAQLTVTGKI